MTQRAVVVVTGATAGVGFGVCHRLLDQLCYISPPDTSNIVPLPATTKANCANRLPHCEALTLVLPCRSLQRGHRAKARLLELINKRVAYLKRFPDHKHHAERFLAQLEIDVIYCDLAVIQTIVDFASVVTQRYSYVSHMVNNAGIGSFVGVDVLKGFKEVLCDPVRAVTMPTYKVQSVGETSVDGLGLVWQCNVFGHYVMFRLLAGLLQNAPQPTSRVLWMSSLEADIRRLSTSDWQLIESRTSYEDSKSQTDLVCLTLDRKTSNDRATHRVRHILVQPGVVSTDILGAKHIGFLLNWIKILAFYFARLLGSQNHTITPHSAAVSTVHALVSPSFDESSASFPYGKSTQDLMGVKFNAKTDRLGHPFVDVQSVPVTSAHVKKTGENLMIMIDSLCDGFIAKSKSNDLNGGTPR